MRRFLRRAALLAAITLALGSSTCRFRSSTREHDEEGDESRETWILFPLPGAAPLVLPRVAVGRASP